MRYNLAFLPMLLAACGASNSAETISLTLSVPDGNSAHQIGVELITEAGDTPALSGSVEVLTESDDVIEIATEPIRQQSATVPHKYTLDTAGLGLVVLSRPSGTELWIPYYMMRTVSQADGSQRRVTSNVFSEASLARGRAELVAMAPGVEALEPDDLKTSFLEPPTLDLDYLLFVLPTENWGELEGTTQRYVIKTNQTMVPR